MTMFITNHKLQDSTYVPSPNHGGTINPKFIVMHYTAGFTASSAVGILTKRGSGVSAHATVGTDGKIYQHVPFNVKAWHAGPSKYMGYSGLNNHSIGIEIVNPGWFRKSGNYYVRGNIRKSEKEIGPLIESPNPRVGSGNLYWPEYTAKQLEALKTLTKSLISKYKILDIVSHEEIDTRGWKTDPGPAFPMQEYKFLLNNRNADVDEYEVTARRLNVRHGPGTNYEISRTTYRGNRVEFLDKRGDWIRINDEEWVHGGYLRRV